MIEAVGVDQPTDRAFGVAGDLAADQHVDLHDAARQDGGARDDGEAFEFGGDFRPAGGEGEAELGGGIPCEAKLCDAGDRHSPGEGQAHIPAEFGGHEHHRDEDQVHQHRDKPRLGEVAVGVQDAGQQGDEADEQDVVKADLAVKHRQIKAGIACET